MSNQNDQDAAKSRLSLRPGGRLELGKTEAAGSVRQSFSHGRSKVVQVEVLKKRTVVPSAAPAKPAAPAPSAASTRVVSGNAPPPRGTTAPAPQQPAGRPLTQAEQAIRQRVLDEQRKLEAQRQREERERQALMVRSAAEEAARRAEDDARRAEEETRRAAEEARQRAADEAAARRAA
ncbi:translation initiation factor IF-2 associated domain-containing protein, partial [Rhodovarius lipocyclicus]|uniref:translation initiation factor IF-2 associated domain-containing protein n=1 Tax=Rhodovarius lipocyclicus TaxID=268410 RepID=UPI00191793E6